MKDPEKLLEIAKDLVSNDKLKPRDGDTFCNIATQIVAAAFGYSGFNGLMANQMIDVMENNKDVWSVIPLDKAQELVNKGTWIVAGQKENVHGHVCTLIPGEMQRSIHWSIQAPVCVNVGKDVFMGKGINWAFKEIPKLYAWRNSL